MKSRYIPCLDHHMNHQHLCDGNGHLLIQFTFGFGFLVFLVRTFYSTRELEGEALNDSKSNDNTDLHLAEIRHDDDDVFEHIQANRKWRPSLFGCM